jgi:hypothetical protein
MNIPFEDKCEILADIWLDEYCKAVFGDVMESENLSFPFAFGLHYQHILRLSEEAEAKIEKLFDLMVELIEADTEIDLRDIVRVGIIP